MSNRTSAFTRLRESIHRLVSEDLGMIGEVTDPTAEIVAAWNAFIDSVRWARDDDKIDAEEITAATVETDPDHAFDLVEGPERWL